MTRRRSIRAYSDVSSRYQLHILVAIAGLVTSAILGVLSPISITVAAAFVLVLIGLATLSPVGILAALTVTLPYFYHPIGIGTLEFAVSEVLLGAALAGTSLRLILDVLRTGSPVRAIRAVAGTLVQSRLMLFLGVLTLAGAGALLFVYDASARGASLREWRWSLFEPFVFLGLLTISTRYGPSRVLLAGGLIAAGVIAAAHGVLDVAGGGGVAADNVRRLSGPFPHPNALALFMLRPVVLAAALVALEPRWRRALVFPSLLTGAALLGTFSRGAMIALGAAAVLLALDAPRRAKLAVGSLAAGSLALIFLIARERMGNLLEGGSVSLRLDIWSSAIAMIRDRPVLGYGPDQFLYAYAPRYIQPTAWDERFTSHAHNLLADSWIRLGMLGAVAAVIALVAVGKRILEDRGTRFERSTQSRAATIALGATLVHGLIDNAYFAHDLALSAWLLAWLAFEPEKQPGERVVTDG